MTTEPEGLSQNAEGLYQYEESPAGPPASRSRFKRIVLACLLALGVLIVVLVVWIGGLLWGQIDESKVPSDSAFPPVPSPSVAGEITTQCGSGGCWREMVVEIDPTQSAQSVTAAMGVASERCGPLNVWTMRKTCVGKTLNSTGKELRIYLLFDESLSKY
jgi:hypothetical protein